MATMDIIKQSGGDPANFLDVGGTADADRVEKAFNIILKDSNVKGILVNIFGGIVRCDRVAKGIVQAYKSIGNIPVPIIVRLQGTNAEEAKSIIDNSGLNVHSAVRMVLELRLLLVHHSAQYRDADDEQSEVALSDLSILASNDSKIWYLYIDQCPSDSVGTN